MFEKKKKKNVNSHKRLLKQDILQIALRKVLASNVELMLRMRDTHLKQKETLTWDWKKELRSKVGLIKREFHGDETGNKNSIVGKKLKT